MECAGRGRGVRRAGNEVPISSNKSMIGHTLTAAGAVEAIFTAAGGAARRAAADHQLRDARPCPAGGLRAQCRARGAGALRDVQFVRLRRPERVPGDRRGRLMTAQPRALVIGGGRGIGAAVVETLARQDWAVSYTYRTAPSPFDASIPAVRLDLGDRDAVEAFARTQEDAPAWDALVHVGGTAADDSRPCWTRPPPRRPCRSISSRLSGLRAPWCGR